MSVYNIVENPMWLPAAFAVSIAIALMHLTKTLHPPGGATELITVIGGDRIHTLGYSYVISPILFGVVVMVIVSILANNSVKGRSYPSYWI